MDFSLLDYHDGFCDFFTSCLLYLNPSDLKACRLVCVLWNKIIRERVWGSKAVRASLNLRLVQRWMKTDPEVRKIGTTRGVVKSLFANNKHIFCGQNDGVIGVFTFALFFFIALEQQLINCSY